MSVNYAPLCALCHRRHTPDPSGVCAACQNVKKIPAERIYSKAMLRLRAALWAVELWSRRPPSTQSPQSWGALRPKSMSCMTGPATSQNMKRTTICKTAAPCRFCCAVPGCKAPGVSVIIPSENIISRQHIQSCNSVCA